MSKSKLLACAGVAALLAACSPAGEDAAETSGEVDVAEATAGAAPVEPASAENDAGETETANVSDGMDADNPFFADAYGTPFNVPDFAAVEFAHYQPAFDAGMAEVRADMQAIIDNDDAPTFANTLEAMERSGPILTRVANVFFNLTGADTTDEIQELQAELSPQLSRMNDEIYLNDALFQRVNAIYEQRDDLGLDGEQLALLDRYHLDFVRAGALLDEDEKAQLSELNAQISELTTAFGQNHLANTTAFDLHIDDEARLAGLPDNLVAAAARAAEQRDHEGGWSFGLNRSSFEGFMTYAEDRELREQLWRGYVGRGAEPGETNNQQVLIDIARLRAERAELMGYATHADYVLADRMAGGSDQVMELLNDIWPRGLARAVEERADMQAMIAADGGDFELAAWDWWHYAERVRQERYDLDSDATRPYFGLDNVRDAAFDLANRVWGLTFVANADIPVYNDVVQGYEVLNSDGSHLGVYLFDPYARPSKRDGAWMNTYRDSSSLDGEVRPIVVNVFNFTQPPEGEAMLLSFTEANTVFHEFGHALHGLVTTARYERLSGTSVSRDFVEFPSQILENWAFEPDMLRGYAVHNETGEPIPDDLIERIDNARRFNQGFGTTEYLAASMLDMRWHSMTAEEAAAVTDAAAFEDDYLSSIGITPEIQSRYRSPYFGHIFAGGYAAGYYGYIWAEVLDADAYAAFTESGDPFNPELAQRLRETIFEPGGTMDEMDMFIAFRGREPSVEPLLERRGLTDVGG